MLVAPAPPLVDESADNHVVLEFVTLAKTAEGKQVDRPWGQKLELHLTAEKLASLKKTGLLYNGALDLAPGEYSVHFVVRDDLSGRVGSVAAPLKVEWKCGVKDLNAQFCSRDSGYDSGAADRQPRLGAAGLSAHSCQHHTSTDGESHRDECDG
jgi:hypothetical protein